MDSLRQDLRFALRSLRQRPLFALVAGVSLALGIGVNTGIFSLGNALLFRPVAGVAGQERVVEIGRAHVRYGGFDSFTWPDLVDIGEEVPALTEVAGFRYEPFSVARDGEGLRANGVFVTPSYFRALGLEAARGRLFGDDAAGGVGEHPVVVVGHDFWQGRLGGDPGVVGSTLLLNRRAHTVVGVLDPAFRGHMIGYAPDVYVPMSMFPVLQGRDHFDERRASWFMAMGRLAPDATVDLANRQLDALAARLAEAYPESNAERTFRAAPLGPLPAAARGPTRAFVGVLAALVGIILLVACANVAGMYLARAATREREIAVRLALGAGRRRLVQQLLSETLVVFVLGGAVGAALAWWGMDAIPLDRIRLPIDVRVDLAPDGGVLLLALAATLGTGIVFGLLPALGATRLDLRSSLGEGGAPGGTRLLRRAFVTAQVGLSLVLLVGAALFLRSVLAVTDTDQGFDPEDAYMVMVDLGLEGYGPEDGRRAQEQILASVRAVPGVRSAALAVDLPLDLSSYGVSAWPEPVPGAALDENGRVSVAFNAVTPGYFQTLEVPLLQGRTFGPGDAPGGAPVVVVSRTFARTVMPGVSPLGRTVRVRSDEAEPATIVGVVEDVRNSTVTETPEPAVYTPLAQDYHGAVQVLADAPGGLGVVGPALRAAVLDVDPSLSLTPAVPVEEWTGLGLLPHRLAAGLTTVLAALALFLSGLGLYGVLASMVARRTREIGVRMALGAGRRRVTGLVVRGTLLVALPGLAVGAGLSVALARILQSQGFLLGVGPADPLALGTVVALVTGVTVLAAWAPARRASRIEPVRALRSE